MEPRVALATCAEREDGDHGDELLVPALARRGVRAESVLWDAPVDWSAYDLVVVRSARDYAARRDRFVDWAASVPRLENPGRVLVWNSDKHYLAGLEREGVPVVPTTWLEPSHEVSSRWLHTRFPALGDFVIKPAVGAGAADTGRYTSVDAYSRGLAIRHALRLLTAGRTVMVQRYVRSVDVEGETALFFIDGHFSHAMQKSAVLADTTALPGAALQAERVRPVRAEAAQVAAAWRALAAAQATLGLGARPLLYARVDLIAGEQDEPLLLELEATKSTMYLDRVPEAADRLAEAITRRLDADAGAASTVGR